MFWCFDAAKFRFHPSPPPVSYYNFAIDSVWTIISTGIELFVFRFGHARKILLTQTNFTLPSRSQRINALIVKTGNKWLFQKSKKDNVAHFHFSNFTIEHETLLSSLLIARCWLGEAWKIYLLKLSVFLHYSTWLMAFREHKWTQHTVSPQKKS